MNFAPYLQPIIAAGFRHIGRMAEKSWSWPIQGRASDRAIRFLRGVGRSCTLTRVSRRTFSRAITVPVLVMHGDDDQIVPYADSAPLSVKLLKNGTLKTYKGFPHGMPTTEAEAINADLLAFIEG
jgi:pimeloyl-ACP methyl ester carboxylesterase